MTIQERAREAQNSKDLKDNELIAMSYPVRATIAAYLACKYLDMEAETGFQVDHQRGIVRADGLVFTAKPYEGSTGEDYGHALYIGMRCEHGRNTYEGKLCKDAAWVKVDSMVRLAEILANEDRDIFYCDTHGHTGYSDW